MNFSFSEEQDLLRRSAADFLRKECPVSYVREMMEDDRGFADEVWNGMAGLGWTGLTIPEQYGGAGLSLVDLTVVLEEMGKAVLPGPFFSTVALGAPCVAAGGSPEQKAALLSGVAAGRIKLTLALLEATARWDEDGVRLTADRDGSGYVLNGIKLFVPDAHIADHIICAARTPDGVTLFVVDRTRTGVETRLLKTLDQTRRLCEVRFDGVQVGDEAMLGVPGQGWALLSDVLDRAKVALCAEMCGGAQQVLDMSVEYAKMREQFGRPIGVFQAVQHTCADMLIAVESAKSATYYAAWALADRTEDAALAAARAKACCSDAFRTVAGQAVQVHGGVGFTWEHDLHLYFKRAKGSEVTFGDAAWNRELVARHTLD